MNNSKHYLVPALNNSKDYLVPASNNSKGYLVPALYNSSHNLVLATNDYNDTQPIHAMGSAAQRSCSSAFLAVPGDDRLLMSAGVAVKAARDLASVM